MKNVYLSLGSNLGDRINNCINAINMLKAQNGVRVVMCSSFYETEPVGCIGQDWFVNCVVGIKTIIPPRKLLGITRDIEIKLGRKEEGFWEPRIIDIDLLLYSNKVISDYNLQIPHLLMHERRFVLEPLAEIAPELEHPILFCSIKDLLDSLEDSHTVIPIIGLNGISLL